MMRLSEVRNTLERIDFHPSRRLGQNFLIDGNILKILTDALDVHGDDSIVEIGPGLGAATERLLCCGGRVTAVEKDRALYCFLRDRFTGADSFELIHADVLDLDLGSFYGERQIRKVFSNLPYSSGSRILVEHVKLDSPPHDVVVTVQSEVAQRMAAGPSQKGRSFLGILVQAVYDVQLIRKISPSCFWPVPEVESAIVRLTRHSDLFAGRAEKCDFIRFSKMIFKHRRKQIASILRRCLPASGRYAAHVENILEVCGISPQSRPGDLLLEQWILLTAQLKKFDDLNPSRKLKETRN